MYPSFYDSLIFFTPDFFIHHCVFIFILGLFFGSFLNVCIYRIPLGQSIVFPNSHCFSCGLPISWYDNIPLLSYLILRGRCRNCESSFSSRYFFIELLTGALYFAVFFKFRYSFATLFYIGFVSSMIVATFTDIDHWIIPDRVSIGGLIISLIVALFAKWIGAALIISHADPFYGNRFYATFLNSLFGAFVGFFILWIIGIIGGIIFRKEAMGWGDIKLFAYVGAVLGAFNTILVLVISSLLGATVGISLILAKYIVNYKNNKNNIISETKKNKEELIEDNLSSINENNSKPEEIQNKTDININNIPANEIQTNSIQSELQINSPQDKIEQIIKVLQEQKSKRSFHQLPFGPYICVAAIVLLFFEDKLNYFFNNLFLP